MAVHRPQQNVKGPRQHHHEDVCDQIARDRKAKEGFRSNDVLRGLGGIASRDELAADKDFSENARRHLNRVNDADDLRRRVLGRCRRINSFGRA
jgi:hypothetical protein